MTFAEFKGLLAARGCKPTGNGRQVSALCPAHKEKRASMTASEGSDGKVLVHCHAGCDPEAICASLGLRLADLFPPKRNGPARRIVAEYDYQDEGGEVLTQVVRFTPKDFKQRRPDASKADGWNWSVKGTRRVLFHLPQVIAAVGEQRPVYVPEGEKDVLALEAAGFAATCNPGGADKWRAEYGEPLRGADVVIIADKDKAGREHAQDVAAKLHGVAGSVKVVELPDTNGKKVKDAADFFAAGGQAAELDELAQAAPEWEPRQTEPAQDSDTTVNALVDPRPKIRLAGDNHLLSECAREVGKVLATKEIFKRGGLVVVVNDRRDGLIPMTPETLRTWIEQHMVCFKVHKLSGTDQTIQFKRTLTREDAAGILASPQFAAELQELENFNAVRVPVLRRDGSVELLRGGYDRESKSFTVDSVPIAEMGFAEAKALLDGLLAEFIFADGERSRAVAAAAMVTVFAIGLLPSKTLRPCFIFLANAEGAGKTLLVKLACVPVLGHTPTGTAPREEAEMKKLLLATIIEDRRVLFFDNWKGHLQSPAFEAFLSAPEYADRVLGLSKFGSGPNNTVAFVTGNGCTVSQDMRRRSLFGELRMEAERAEDRIFKNSLDVPVLLQRRGEILGALWALVQHWDRAGRPKPSRTNSSFTDWTNIIGGVVEHAGFGCAVEPPQIEAAVDTDGADMRTLVEAIAEGETGRVTFEELIAAAREKGLFERVLPPEGDLDAKARSVLGKLFRRYDRRLVGGCRFILEGKGATRQFRVEKLERAEPGADPPEVDDTTAAPAEPRPVVSVAKTPKSKPGFFGRSKSDPPTEQPAPVEEDAPIF